MFSTALQNQSIAKPQQIYANCFQYLNLKVKEIKPLEIIKSINIFSFSVGPADLIIDSYVFAVKLACILNLEIHFGEDISSFVISVTQEKHQKSHKCMN